MKNQSLFYQFAVIGSGAVLNMLIGLLTTPLITRLVDPEQYGQATMLGTYANIALMLLSLGLDQALMRFFYKEDSLAYRKKILLYCSQLPLIIAVLAFAVVFLGRNFWGITINTNIFFLFACYVLVLIVNRFAVLLLRLTKKANLYAIISILHKIVYVIAAISLVRLVQRNAYISLVFAHILAYFIVTLIAIASERKTWNPIGASKEISVSTYEMVRFGFPLMIANGIYMFFQAIDKLSLNYFCSYTDVGVYASAMSMMSIISILRTTFCSIWMPASVEQYEKNPNDKTFFIKGNQYLTVIMFVFGLTLILCKDIIVLLLGEKYRDASRILPFLLLQPIMYTVSETTVVGVYFKKKSYTSIVVSAVSCLANLCGNIILIPIFGAKGAAISTGLSYVLFFGLRTFFSNMYYPIEFSLGKFSVVTIITLAFAAYNTWYDFSYITVVMYCVSISIVLLLYKQSVHELTQIAFEKIRSIVK